MNSVGEPDLAAALRAAVLPLWAHLAAHPQVRRRPALTPETIERLLRYLDVLCLWRAKTSLVATSDPSEIVTRHIVDALAILPFLGPGERIADLGSGAGLPGLVLAIAAPDLEVLLIEPRRKRVSFLQEAIRATATPRCRVLAQRAEAVGPGEIPDLDTITARAFGPLDALLTAAGRLVSATGCEPVRLIAMKGPKGPEEAAALGGEGSHLVLAPYELDDGTPRVLLLYPELRAPRSERFT